MSGTSRLGTAEAVSLDPREAIAYLRGKTNTPTQRWSDVWQEAHARSFSVAGAASEALLADIRAEVDKALAGGQSLKDFRRAFAGIVRKHGWEHTGTVGWRARIIYETNLSTAYSAGRYAEMTTPAALIAYPYWQYVHSGSAHPRPHHKAWNGTTLRANDPWWDTHYAPNGWGCRCRVRPVSAGALRRMGKTGPDQAPPLNMRMHRLGDGREVAVPEGIDPGFAYNPGKAWAEGRDPPGAGGPRLRAEALPPPAPPAPLLPGEPPARPSPGRPAAPRRDLELPEASDLGTVPGVTPPRTPRAPDFGAEQYRIVPLEDPVVPATVAPPALPAPVPATLPAAPSASAEAVAGRAELEAMLARPEGRLTIGRLPPVVQEAIAADAPQVLLSRETMVKQLAHHPDLTVDEYLSIAGILARPELVLQEPAKPRHASLVRLVGAMHHVVVKATQDGRDVYLVSFYRIRPADLARLLRRSEILLDDRPKDEEG